SAGSVSSRPRLHWRLVRDALPWAVLLVSLLATLLLWKGAQEEEQSKRKAAFDARVHEVLRDIGQRMKAYEEVLRGTQGLFAVFGNEVTRRQFHTYVGKLQLEGNYPGIQGLGYALILSPERKSSYALAVNRENRKEGLPGFRIHPEGVRPLYTSVIYLEPLAGRNLLAYGYDMYSDQVAPRAGDSGTGVRHAAMVRARDTGEIALSGSVRLLMELDDDVRKQSGVLMYLPVYRHGASTDTVAQRRAAIIGWVYAPFRMDNLMDGLLSGQTRDLAFEIFDGESMADGVRLYDSEHGANPAAEARYRNVTTVHIAGRTWTVATHSLPGFETPRDQARQDYIALGGIGVSLLLMIVARLLTRGHERVLVAAREMNRELIRSEAKLNAMLDNLPFLTWLKDSEGRFAAVNQTFFKTTGRSQLQEVLGKTDLDIWPRELAEKYRADDAEVIATGRQKSCLEQCILLEGRLGWVETFKAPIFDKNGTLIGTTGVAQDITERIRSQQTIERVSLLYKMLSEINSANIHIRERKALFEAACRIIMASGLFRMVWVGLIDPESGLVVPVAQDGHVDGYLDLVRINVHREDPQGPTVEAIRSGAYVACEDIATDPRMTPWREEAMRRGYHSSIIFPLKQAGQVIGAFTLYFMHRDMVARDVIDLLGSLMDDIAFTLDFIAESQQRERAQQELQDLSMFLQAARENERAHIARELHDELGQSMTALRFDLKWLGEAVNAEDRAVHRKLRAMNDLVGHTVDSIRRISEDLRPG
ncbi:MAG: CHASE domain-containing protein, partial [Betaproteobacteria bacterium]|nr:CHASE domain-containing protein [Betaproteobacteria bacterium]